MAILVLILKAEHLNQRDVRLQLRIAL